MSNPRIVGVDSHKSGCPFILLTSRMEKVVKEVKLNIGGIWGCITAIIVAAMLCGTAVFVSMQYSQTQKDVVNAQKEIADKQSQAMKESAEKIGKGLTDIGWYQR